MKGIRKKRAVTMTLLAGAVAFGLAGMDVQGQVQSAASKQPAPVVPQTGAAQKEEPFLISTKDIPDVLLVTGELQAARSRDILVPRVRSGFASAVTFLPLEGTHVKAGQRVAEFDASALLSQRIENERQLDEAKLKILKTKADLDAQRTDLILEVEQQEANRKIAKIYADIPKELQPANTYQKYQLDLEKAQLALDKAKERLANHDESRASQLALVELEKQQQELDLKRIDADIASMQIDAPQDGIIIYGDNWANNRKVQIGDTLFPGMPVITLPDLATMQVVGFVYDTELRSLSPGMRCELHLDAVPGRTWRGAIQSLTSVATRKSFASTHKVFRAVIQIEQPDTAVMKPGMTVRVEIPVSLASAVVAIPREYLGLDAAGSYYVLKGSDRKTATRQAVAVGVFSERLVQITAGLQAGDRILKVQGVGEAKS